MRPVKQEFEHNPPESIGDCFRACVATILELPLSEVPHFAALSPHPDDFWQRVDYWLAIHGYERVTWASVTLPSISYMGPLIVVGDAGRGSIHACVYYEGKLFHDPSTSDTANGLTAPCDDGLYWVNMICKL